MYYHVRHSIPGRIRLEYDKRRIGPIRASLAENLIAVQEGITAISFNSNVGTFLVYYDISKLSECEVLAFFSAIDGRYLDDPSMLASVREPDVSISLAGTLVSMTVSYCWNIGFNDSFICIKKITACFHQKYHESLESLPSCDGRCEMSSFWPYI